MEKRSKGEKKKKEKRGKGQKEKRRKELQEKKGKGEWGKKRKGKKWNRSPLSPYPNGASAYAFSAEMEYR